MARITPKGQATIPAAIRQRFGFLPGTEVELLVEDGSVRLGREGPCVAACAEKAVGAAIFTHAVAHASSEAATADDQAEVEAGGPTRCGGGRQRTDRGRRRRLLWSLSMMGSAVASTAASAASPWPSTHSGSGPSIGRPVKNLAAMQPPWQAS